MAAVTHGVSTPTTTNAQSYTSGAFTPAVDDLIVVFVVATATVATPGLTDSVGGTFTLARTQTKAGSGDLLLCFVADQLAAATSRTLTFTCTGDAASGCIIQAARVSGMSRVGLDAVRQSAGASNQAAGGTPGGSLGAAVLTTNPTFAYAANGTNPSGLPEPVGWTERDDTGYATPTTGAQYDSRDSGFTGTSIVWNGSSATAYGWMAIELDASAAGAGQPTMRRWGGVPFLGGKISGGGRSWGHQVRKRWLR